MRRDLEAARKKWLESIKDEAERTHLERHGFLTYQDDDGAFADFHANRHTFITNLGREGVPLTVAQKLVRRSNPKLTSGIYTHLGVHDQAGAIASLPAPPDLNEGKDGPQESEAAVLRATGTDPTSGPALDISLTCKPHGGTQ
jgi:hypothetical protein